MKKTMLAILILAILILLIPVAVSAGDHSRWECPPSFPWYEDSPICPNAPDGETEHQPEPPFYHSYYEVTSVDYQFHKAKEFYTLGECKYCGNTFILSACNDHMEPHTPNELETHPDPVTGFDYHPCQCKFCHEKLYITPSDYENHEHTRDFSNSFIGPDGKTYFCCKYHIFGCDWCFQAEMNDNHSHNIVLGYLASTGPSSTSNGGKQHYCTICGHTECEIYGCEDFYPATCTEPAKCKKCGLPNGEALGHAWINDGREEKTNEVRPLGKGTAKEYISHERKYVQKQRCNNNDNCPTKTRTVVTWKSEKHDWPAWTTKKATCIAEGSKTRVCNICEKKQKETLAIDKSNHDFPAPKIVRAACHPEGGIALTHCNRCGQEQYSKPAKTSHNVKSWTIVTNATCSTKGVKRGKCTACNTTVTYTIPLKEHLYAGSPAKCKFCGKPKNIDTQ